MNTIAPTALNTPRNWLLLLAFLVVVLGVGALIGMVTAPGEWYASLEKPPFNPPSWLFGPVWTALYVLIAIAGWRTFVRDAGGTGMKLWYGQMVLNWAWSPLWFVLHMTWGAFMVIVLILALVIAFIVNRWNKDRAAALMFVPYAAWVGFASVLNLSIAILN